MAESDAVSLPPTVLGAAPGIRRLIARTAGLSGLTIAGQAVFLVALPLLSRLFSPAALGLFTIYLSAVNIAGPIVGLKFEAALFGLEDRRDRRAALIVALLSSAANSVAAAALIACAAPWISGDIGLALRALLPLLPLGFALSGIWAASTAWAVRDDALGILSVARFLQPASMTALQVAFGLFHLSAPWLAAAHAASHLLYAGTIFATTLSVPDLRAIVALRFRDLRRRAYADRRYPLLAMPASLVTTLVGNAPPLLMGALFGAELAGQYGVAYRVVTTPLSMVCLPLGHLFVSEASQQHDPARTRAAACFALAVGLLGVSLPVLALGALAPALSVALLGAPWAPAGTIMAALAIMGAAQALAAPFQDVPALYRRPQARLAIDVAQGILFFLPLACGWAAGWGAIPIIRLMAAGGGLGYLAGAVATLMMVRASVLDASRTHGPPRV